MSGRTERQVAILSAVGCKVSGVGFSVGVRAALRAIGGALCSMVLLGCAVIKDVRADGDTKYSVAFAPAGALPVAAESGAHVLKIAGLGLATTNEQITFGAFDSSEIVLDPRCQIVLVGNTDEQLQRFAKLVRNAPNICSQVTPVGGKK